jgi:hypothetical protein
MIIRASVVPAWPHTAATFALFSLGLLLSGCADMSENVSTAFADPAKYELYDCKQLETERKTLANRAAELQGLMAKAETGVAGSVVSELAYRNDYVAVRGQAHFAEEAWRKNRCHESPPAPAADAKPGPPVKPAGRQKPVQPVKPVASSKSGTGAN